MVYIEKVVQLAWKTTYHVIIAKYWTAYVAFIRNVVMKKYNFCDT